MAKYIHVVLNPPKQERKFGDYASLVLKLLTNNKSYPNLPITLTIFGGHIAAAVQADADVKNKVGSTAAAKAAWEKVSEDLEHYRDYVQLVAESQVATVDLNAIQAMVESAGMKLRKVTPRPKLTYGLEPAPGMASGSLECTAPASKKRDTHEWDYSTNGKDRVFLGGSRKAIAIFSGLPVGVPLTVRHRLLTSKGYTEWLDPPLTITLK